MAPRSNSLIANLLFQDGAYFIIPVCADAISPLINLFGLNVEPLASTKTQTNRADLHEKCRCVKFLFSLEAILSPTQTQGGGRNRKSGVVNKHGGACDSTVSALNSF